MISFRPESLEDRVRFTLNGIRVASPAGFSDLEIDGVRCEEADGAPDDGGVRSTCTITLVGTSCVFHATVSGADSEEIEIEDGEGCDEVRARIVAQASAELGKTRTDFDSAQALVDRFFAAYRKGDGAAMSALFVDVGAVGPEKLESWRQIFGEPRDVPAGTWNEENSIYRTTVEWEHGAADVRFRFARDERRGALVESVRLLATPGTTAQERMARASVRSTLASLLAADFEVEPCPLDTLLDVGDEVRCVVVLSDGARGAFLARLVGAWDEEGEIVVRLSVGLALQRAIVDVSDFDLRALSCEPEFAASDVALECTAVLGENPEVTFQLPASPGGRTLGSVMRAVDVAVAGRPR
jgi:hypothetical protein